MKAEPFTFEERLQIEKYLKLKISINCIGKLIGRSANGITYEIRRAGGQEHYTAEVAETAAKQKVLISSSNYLMGVNARMDSLENQIEILYNKIKELLNDKVN